MPIHLEVYNSWARRLHYITNSWFEASEVAKVMTLDLPRWCCVSLMVTKEIRAATQPVTCLIWPVSQKEPNSTSPKFRLIECKQWAKGHSLSGGSCRINDKKLTFKTSRVGKQQLNSSTLFQPNCSIVLFGFRMNGKWVIWLILFPAKSPTKPRKSATFSQQYVPPLWFMIFRRGLIFSFDKRNTWTTPRVNCGT